MIPLDESGDENESHHRIFEDMVEDLGLELDFFDRGRDPWAYKFGLDEIAAEPDAAVTAGELHMGSVARHRVFRTAVGVTLTLASMGPLAMVAASAADAAEPPTRGSSSSQQAESGPALRRGAGAYTGLVSLNGPVTAGSDSPRPVQGVSPTSVSPYGR